MDNQWISVNCEAKGRSHQICQDKTACIMGPVSVVALADGLTSCSLSHLGAQIVVTQTCQELSTHYWEYYNNKRSAAEFVRILQEAVAQRCETEADYGQMCSTLLFCAIAQDTFLLGHIGDGAILQFGAHCHMISPPQTNEMGGTATYTILDRTAVEHIEFIRGNTSDCDGFLLTSDGLKGNAYCGGTALPQHAYDLFFGAYELRDISPEMRNLQLTEVLESLFANRSETADDCSLCILSRRKLTGYVDYEKENGVDVTVRWPCVCGAVSELSELRCHACRRERTELYQSVRIHSSELFFGEMTQWLTAKDTDGFFSPAGAEIIDPSAFSSLCKALYSASAETGTADSGCLRVEKQLFLQVLRNPSARNELPAPICEAIELIRNSSKKLAVTVYGKHGHNKILLYHHNGQTIAATVDDYIELLPLGSGDETDAFLSGLNLSLCTTLPGPPQQWRLGPLRCLPQSMSEVIEMIIYHIDNGLLQAEGPQYRWLYQIADCLSAVQICVPTATDAEDRTVYFLHCELCSWCIHIDSGQLILEISDHSMCQKYIQSLYNAITN